MTHDHLTFFTTFLAAVYDLDTVTLFPLGSSRADQGVLYRVDQKEGPSWVLRTYPQESSVPWWFGGGFPQQWLDGQAATLMALAQQHYPAPRLLLTRTGELVGVHQGWCSLMTSFIPGNRLEKSPDNLRQLASVLGRLHALPHDPAAFLSMTPSWWYPPRTLTQAVDHLLSAAHHVRADAQALATSVERTLRVIQQCSHLPLSLIHGDCWPENALQTSQGGVMLLDWECAGVGAAILDLGGLLIDCHPDPLPGEQIQVDSQDIVAIMEGYCQERMLSRVEMDILLEALQFGVAFHIAIRFSWIPQEGWSERVQRSLARLQARFQVCEQIVPIVEDYVEHIM